MKRTWFARIAAFALALGIGAGAGIAASSSKVAESDALAAETVYVFKSADWKANVGTTAANWTSGKAGTSYANNGIGVTATGTGANGTSPISFNDISKIVLTYNTNKSAGAGSFDVKIGTNDASSQSAGFSGSGDGRTANFTVQFDYATPQSGAVKITINTTTNSLYLVSCAITWTAPDPVVNSVSIGEPTQYGIAAGEAIIDANAMIDGTNLLDGNVSWSVTSENSFDPAGPQEIENVVSIAETGDKCVSLKPTVNTPFYLWAVSNDDNSKYVGKQITPALNTEKVGDTITEPTTGLAPGTQNYTDWSDKTDNSGAKFAGNTSASKGEVMQIRGKTNSGVIVTYSENVVYSVRIKWNSNTLNGNALALYGKSSAYSSTSELYDEETRGTELHQFTYDSTADSLYESFTVTGNYKYFGMKAADDYALYIDSIAIAWTPVSDTLTDLYIEDPASVNKDFYVGDKFSFSGSKVFAVINNDTEHPEEVTASVTWPDTALTLGQTSIKGSYTYKTVTLEVEVTGLNVVEYVPVNYGRLGKALNSYVGTYYFAYTYLEEEAEHARVWTGATDDSTSSYVAADVTDGKIVSTSVLDKGLITIAAMEGGYSLKNAKGDYLAPKKSGSAFVVSASAEPVAHTITTNYDGTLNISSVLEETTYYLRFNANAGQDRARYYASATSSKGFTLFGPGATPVVPVTVEVQEFVDGYMHMSDYTEESGWCKDSDHHYYADAKTAFNALNDEQRDCFMTSSTFKKPYERLCAWAAANGDSVTATGIVAQLRNIGGTSSNSNSAWAIVVTLIASAAIATGLVFISRRRRAR